MCIQHKKAVFCRCGKLNKYETQIVECDEWKKNKLKRGNKGKECPNIKIVKVPTELGKDRCITCKKTNDDDDEKVLSVKKKPVKKITRPAKTEMEKLEFDLHDILLSDDSDTSDSDTDSVYSTTTGKRKGTKKVTRKKAKELECRATDEYSKKRVHELQKTKAEHDEAWEREKARRKKVDEELYVLSQSIANAETLSPVSVTFRNEAIEWQAEYDAKRAKEDRKRAKEDEKREKNRNWYFVEKSRIKKDLNKTFKKDY